MKRNLGSVCVVAIVSSAKGHQHGPRGLRESPYADEIRRLQDSSSYESPNYPTYEAPPTPIPKNAPTTPPVIQPVYERPVFEKPIVFSPINNHPSWKDKKDDDSWLGEEAFIGECEDELLSPSDTGDGLISQHDFAEFLTDYCIWQGVCKPKDTLQFDALPTPIQRAFVAPLCASGTDCLDEIEPEFGYTYNHDTQDEVEEQIKGICSSLYPLLGDYAAPTPAPATGYPQPSNPSISPHDAPISPTKSPTDYPRPSNPSTSPHDALMSPMDYPTRAPASTAPQKTVRPTQVPETAAPIHSTIAPIDSPNFAPNSLPSPIVAPIPPTAPVSLATPSSGPQVPITEMPVTQSPFFGTDSPMSGPISFAPVTGPDTITPFTPSPSTSPSPTKTTDVPTQSPPANPTTMPSATPATVFINEIGTFNGSDFVEVAFSDFLGSDINGYGIYAYGSSGMVLGSVTLGEGNSADNGLLFTVATAPSIFKDARAVALVDYGLMTTLHFLSSGLVVTAVNGPADGLNSTDITMGDESRMLQSAGANSTAGSSFSLTGNGCTFEEFTFGETASTPGTINVDQSILGCRHVPTPSPSNAPVNGGGTSGISTGAIVGISISGGLCLVLVLSLFRGERNVGGETEGVASKADKSKNPKDAAQAKELMIDTGELQGAEVDPEDIGGADDEVKSKTQSSWWNAVFWTKTGSSKVLTRTGEEMDAAPPQTQWRDIQFEAEEDDVTKVSASAPVAGAAAADAADATEAQPQPKQSWFGSFLQSSKEIESEGGDPDDTPEDGSMPVTRSVSKTPKTANRKKAPVRPTTGAAAIALSRKDEDNFETKSLSPAEVRSEALENLDAALDKGDWNQIYDIADKISKTDDSPIDSGKRNFLGLARGTSRAAAAALPDIGSSASESGSGSGSGVLGAAARKGVQSSEGQSEFTGSAPDDSIEGFIGASPRQETDEANLGFISGVVGATAPTEDKKSKKKLSQRNWISGLFKKKKHNDSDGDDSSSVNVVQSSMEAIQKEFDPQLPVPADASEGAADDAIFYSLVTGSMGEVSLLSTPDRQPAAGRQAERDAERLDIATESIQWANRQTSLVESIEKMAAELEAQAAVEKTPSLASADENEEALEQLIEAKDWEGVDDFVKSMEVFNESELETIKNRNESLENEEARIAQAKVKKELAAITLRETESKQPTSYQAVQDVPTGAKDLIPFWKKKEEEASQSSASTPNQGGKLK